MNKLYEIVDATDCYKYQTLGIFTSLDLAIEAIHCEIDERYPLSDKHEEDFEIIEILEICEGWRNHQKSVYTINRKMSYYDEKTDEQKWITNE